MLKLQLSRGTASIPNTVVKLNYAENTWREAAWEDRSMLTFYFCLLRRWQKSMVMNPKTDCLPIIICDVMASK